LSESKEALAFDGTAGVNIRAKIFGISRLKKNNEG
jgi:hypothetical protein